MKWTKDYRVGEQVEVCSDNGRTWHPAVITRKTRSGQIIVNVWDSARAIYRKGEIRKLPGGAPKLSEAAIERIINEDAPPPKRERIDATGVVEIRVYVNRLWLEAAVRRHGGSVDSLIEKLRNAAQRDVEAAIDRLVGGEAPYQGTIVASPGFFTKRRGRGMTKPSKR